MEWGGVGQGWGWDKGGVRFGLGLRWGGAGAGGVASAIAQGWCRGRGRTQAVKVEGQAVTGQAGSR